MRELPQKFNLVVEDDAGRRALLRLDQEQRIGYVFTELDHDNRPLPDARVTRALSPEEIDHAVALIQRLEDAGERHGAPTPTDVGDRLVGTDPDVNQALMNLVMFVLGPNA